MALFVGGGAKCPNDSTGSLNISFSFLCVSFRKYLPSKCFYNFLCKCRQKMAATTIGNSIGKTILAYMFICDGQSVTSSHETFLLVYSLPQKESINAQIWPLFHKMCHERANPPILSDLLFRPNISLSSIKSWALSGDPQRYTEPPWPSAELCTIPWLVHPLPFLWPHWLLNTCLWCKGIHVLSFFVGDSSILKQHADVDAKGKGTVFWWSNIY